MLRLVYAAILLALFWSGYQATFAGSRTADDLRCREVRRDDIPHLRDRSACHGTRADTATLRRDHRGRETAKDVALLDGQPAHGLEIVADKMLGRLPHLAVLAWRSALPIVSILGLVGGVPAEHVVVAYIGTASTCAFAAALTVLISTLARRVRQAVLLAYTLAPFGWFLGPAVCLLFGSTILLREYQWIRPVNDVARGTTPVGCFLEDGPSAWANCARALSSALQGDFDWMVGLQLGGAALFLLLAVWRLRPTFRRQEETPVRLGWLQTTRAQGPPPALASSGPSAAADAVSGRSVTSRRPIALPGWCWCRRSSCVTLSPGDHDRGGGKHRRASP